MFYFPECPKEAQQLEKERVRAVEYLERKGISIAKR